jgi:hypothetical protein
MEQTVEEAKNQQKSVDFSCSVSEYRLFMGSWGLVFVI